MMPATERLLDGVPSFVPVPCWPKPLPNGWRLRPVNGIALDKSGHPLVNNFVGEPPPGTALASVMGDKPESGLPPPILEFDRTGKLAGWWGGPGDGFDWPLLPHGLAIDHNNFVWIGGTYKGKDAQVLKLTRDGQFVMQIGVKERFGGAASVDRLGRPSNLCFDPEANEVYIADGYGNRRIIVLDAETGAFKRMWGAYGRPPVDPSADALDNFYNSDPFPLDGEPPRHFNSPVHAVALSNDGRVYVCDRTHCRIQVFDRTGKFVTEFFFDAGSCGTIGQPAHVAFWPDENQTYLIVGMLTDAFSILVLRRADGEILSRSGSSSEINLLHMFDIDEEGYLYTGEVLGRIQKWRPVLAESMPEASNAQPVSVSITSCC